MVEQDLQQRIKGLPPWQVKKALPLARKADRATLERAICRFADLEVELATLKQDGQRTPDGWAFEGEVPLATPGAFGYTVRVVPRHVGLATASELGLVAWA